MIRRILLDLDNVLNCLTMYALQYLGLVRDATSYAEYPHECGWSIVDAANKLTGEDVWTPARFWTTIPRKLWATVPKHPAFDWLIQKAAELVGEKNVCILTSPTLDPDCAAGKVEWIQANCPRWLQRQYLIGPRKEFCAFPDSLLIDDAEQNVAGFKNPGPNRPGGQAVLMPAPWNAAHDCDPIPYLERALKPFVEELRQLDAPV